VIPVPPRICFAGKTVPQDPSPLAALDFDCVLVDGYRDGLSAPERPDGLALLLDIDMAELADDHPLAGVNDPDARASWWRNALCDRLSDGVTGFRFLHPLKANGIMRRVVCETRAEFADALLILDTPGVAWDDLRLLKDCGFDFCLSSLPWWDLRSTWLAEEYAALRAVAPVMAMADAPDSAESVALRRTRLLLAAIAGTGTMAGIGVSTEAPLLDTVQAMNLLAASEAVLAEPGTLKVFPSASRTVVLRTPDGGGAEEALVAVIGLNGTPADRIDRTVIADLDEWSTLEPVVMRQSDDPVREPGMTRLFRARRAKPVRRTRALTAQKAAREPRLIIEDVAPTVDGGRYAAKRLVGETVRVEATIYSDGHPVLSAEISSRAEDERDAQVRPMRLVANDRWVVDLPLLRPGRHVFTVEAWIDAYATFVRDITKKHDAGKDIRLDLKEGGTLVGAARQHAPAGLREALDAIATHAGNATLDEQRVLLTAPETLQAMRLAAPRAFRATVGPFAIDADRKLAGFAAWYEIFPRSADGARHGTFRDVIALLPHITAMGFDVLYLPPIHPIGRTNRKGRNNTLVALPDDVGSVYAIGSTEGGHDAIHPDLGSAEDFRALVSAAKAAGLEIALDFAVQCSPDHPWLKEHPGWFEWRPDGSLRYAENPPKVYEDIVNVDFYAADAMPGLWIALRDVILHWIGEGVRIFRVDNPHTKPFAFWEWLIADVRAVYPDVLFLAEAFTRPAIMCHLGKVGFSQSYTYFTWRNTKADLTDYIEDITTAPVNAFFRPHFFVNTPDINPVYLQTSGRPGFLIRAALAATLSGLWGMFSGFELCEAAALAGREEYRDSDKYQIRPRDWNAPGNIIREIAQFNRLRKSEPALQSHLGTTFYNAFNDKVIYFGKHPLGHEHRVLVLVSLDPHAPQAVDFEIPLWEWGLTDADVVTVEDLLSGARFVWHGKLQHAVLTPDNPYRIWRIAPEPRA
jgi:starch synthase (maltosyl-transferring)